MDLELSTQVQVAIWTGGLALLGVVANLVMSAWDKRASRRREEAEELRRAKTDEWKRLRDAVDWASQRADDAEKRADAAEAELRQTRQREDSIERQLLLANAKIDLCNSRVEALQHVAHENAILRERIDELESEAEKRRGRITELERLVAEIKRGSTGII